jgi:hypothetical protein
LPFAERLLIDDSVPGRTSGNRRPILNTDLGIKEIKINSSLNQIPMQLFDDVGHAISESVPGGSGRLDAATEPTHRIVFFCVTMPLCW